MMMQVKQDFEREMHDVPHFTAFLQSLSFLEGVDLSTLIVTVMGFG